MSQILTIVVERESDQVKVQYFSSDGLPLDLAIAACDAASRSMREKQIEAEVQRRLADAQATDSP